MVTESGKPRYWINGYDHWHLILPTALVAVVVWISVAPHPAKSNLPPPSLRPPAAVIPRVTPLPAVASTTIESPYPGAVFWPDRMGDVEGKAEPGSRVRLFWKQRFLGETVAEADGRYRFHLTNFPAGQHTLQSVALLGGKTNASAPVTFTVAALQKAAPKRTAKPAPKRKQP